MTENRIWYFGTALVAVAVLALGWLLGVSPKLDEAAAAESDRSTVETQNHAISAELRRLSAEFDDLSDMRGVLTDIRKALPPEAETPSFLAQLGALRASAPVTLTSVSVGDALPYAPPALGEATAETTAEETAEVEGTATDGTTTDGTTTDAATTDGTVTDGTNAAADPAAALPLPADPRVTGENLLLLPVEIEATGSRAELATFLGALQAGERLYLVTRVSTEVNTQPTDPGEFRSTIAGYLYVLLPGDGAEPATESGAEPAAALPTAPAAVEGSAEVTDQ